MASARQPAAARWRATRMSAIQLAATLLLVTSALSASALACEHHDAHGSSAHMLRQNQQAQQRALLAAEQRQQDDVNGVAAEIGIGAAARRLRSPIQSRRQQATQKAAAAAKQPTKSTIEDRMAGPWLTDDGAVRLPQKKPPPPLARPPPKAVSTPAAFTPTSVPMPENAQPLARRVCAFEDDITAAANATAELASRVAYLTSDMASRATVVNINTYFHVIGDSEKAFTYVKQSMITNQIKALNDAYGMANFDFTLSGIDYTINKSWYPVDIYSNAFTALKAKVHTGGAADLNIIVTMLNSGGVIGVATNPWGYGAGDLRYDGVTIDTGTLPGSWYSGYNLGRNAVHEVGHCPFGMRRLGLSHPFIGGCTETNDGISDTAQQAAADYACYAQNAKLPNSCPKKPKSQPPHDPIRNYMGYVPDGCMWEFTNQQAARMTAAWQRYRQYAAGPVKPMKQTSSGKKPTKKKPTQKKPTAKKPTKKKPTKKKPTKKRPTKRPTRQQPRPFCYNGGRYVYSVARKKYVKSGNKGSC